METQVSKAEKAKRPTRYHSKNNLADRYGVVTRTIDRWCHDGLFPEPDLILPNGDCLATSGAPPDNASGAKRRMMLCGHF